MTGALWVLAGYAAGSFPTAYLAARALKGIDIRRVGSGNVGATNVFRAVGPAAGVATLLIDMAKGFVPTALALSALPASAVPVLTGGAAVVGHTWSPWMSFRGGKGVATSAGVFLALLPVPMALAVGAFLLGFVASRRVSVGSLLGAVVLPVAAWVTGAPPLPRGLSLGLAILVIVKHIPNIRRLRRGEEPAVVWTKSPPRKVS